MKLGLKVWSDNDYYVEPALKLYRSKCYDYIELYSVPGSISKYLQLWKKLDIPYIIHAPHYSHGFNLAQRSKRDYNRSLFEEAQRYADALNSKYIIVHCGILGEQKEVGEQLKILNDKRILIENKPFQSLDFKVCAGNSPEEIERYRKSAGVGFCFDVSHAVGYAFMTNKQYVKVIGDFLKLDPVMMHMGGILCDSEVDKHIHLKQSNCGLQEILNAVKAGAKDIKYCTLETPKDSKDDLDDFMEDIRLFKELMGPR